jgi:hypothetical protein
MLESFNAWHDRCILLPECTCVYVEALFALIGGRQAFFA